MFVLGEYEGIGNVYNAHLLWQFITQKSSYINLMYTIFLVQNI